MPIPEADREQWLDHWAERIHCSGLTPVALTALEIGRGLGFLASQALLLVQPVLGDLVDGATVTRYAALLEDPVSLEGLIERIERKAKSHG